MEFSHHLFKTSPAEKIIFLGMSEYLEFGQTTNNNIGKDEDDEDTAIYFSKIDEISKSFQRLTRSKNQIKEVP